MAAKAISTSGKETNNGHLLFEEESQRNRENDSCLVYLKEIRSYEPGFGTRSYRRLMKICLDPNKKGHLVTLASFTSHVFHFKMGMKPINGKIEALPVFLGLEPYLGLTLASKIFHNVMSKVKTTPFLSEDDKKNLLVFKQVLTLQDDQVNEELAASISNETLIEREQEVLNQTVSSLWYQIINPLLKIISKTPASERPCTFPLRPIYCVMSEDGIARWNEDLHGKIPFVPFRQFEHLYCDLFPWQVDLLKAGLASAREKGVKI